MTRITTAEIAILARGETDDTRHEFARKLGAVRGALGLMCPGVHTFSLFALSARALAGYRFACNRSHSLDVLNNLSSDDAFLDVCLLALDDGVERCACDDCARVWDDSAPEGAEGAR